MHILGISAYYHDSAASLISNGKIIAAAQEERFTRKKHDSRFPENAIHYCLKEGGLDVRDLTAITFYDKPFTKFERLIETYISYAPQGFGSFRKAMPAWLKDKIYLKSVLKKELRQRFGVQRKDIPKLLFCEHHHSHAASAFFPGPFEKAAVLCLDGVGEWVTTSAWIGEQNRLSPIWELDFPHSLGMLYSAFTSYIGFEVNSGEYKLMGLASYGEPKYIQIILDNLIDLKEDGTFRLNMDYFNYAVGHTMSNEKFHELFGGPPREPGAPITQREMDLARSIQYITEEIVLRLSRSIYKETRNDFLCMAGGVALNCVANGRLLREGPFKDLWIQPAAGDAGGALGAALITWHQWFNQPRSVKAKNLDSMEGAYLGPGFLNSDVKKSLDLLSAKYEKLDEGALFGRVAEILKNEAVVGWFQGRMEFGPRSLGARSILGDARSSKMQSIMNLKIKYRESFRPFAPAVLAEDAEQYFLLPSASPYMLMVAPVREGLRIPMTRQQEQLIGIDKLNIPRSTIPAVTHVDYSARVQTVHSSTNSRFHRLISEFRKVTGCSVLVNTSFNVRGEPIVCTVEDAFRCFMKTEMDYLVVEDFLLAKSDQLKVTDLHFEILKPEFLGKIYWLWTKLRHILGYLNIRIVLGFLFFFVIAPMGIIMRTLKKDPLAKCFSPQCSTYRIIREGSDLISQMERPF